MKTLFSILTLLLFFQISHASHADSAKPLSSEPTVKKTRLFDRGTYCRKSLESFGQAENAVAWTSEDLISGNWVAEGNFGSYKTADRIELQFNQNGSVDFFVTDLFGRTRHESEWWDVSIVKNQIFLTLDDLDENKMYRLEPTCEGMTMKDIVSGELILLDYVPLKSPAELNLMKNQLIGSWKSMNYPFELTQSLDDCGTFEKMEDATFQIDFEEDGTFERSLGNKLISVDEQGVWELSQGGKFLTLYFTKTDDPETVYGKTTVEVKYLGQQDFWMKQSIETIAYQSMFCTPTRLFTMEKQARDIEMIR